jgi:plasmid stabilization system protein ParE
MAHAYARTAVVPQEFFATTWKPRNRPSLWRRLRDALEQSRERALDREIAVYLSARGGRLTDRAERDIEHIVYSSTRW